MTADRIARLRGPWWLYQSRRQRWCQHARWRRVYGDERNMVRRGRDARCVDCGLYMTKGDTPELSK